MPLVALDHVSLAFGHLPPLGEAMLRLERGERVCVVGRNGAGKSTLLRIVSGEQPPDEGEVRRGANVELAYYDQQREQLDPGRTVFDTVAEGNDTVTVNGRSRHVNAYLRDFRAGGVDRARPRRPVRAVGRARFAADVTALAPP